MPGTIQVTVVEFKSTSSSSSQPSSESLKVSMGKKHFQTWDKGDFSFPITKLGENLVVSLLDAGGNEIANADIQTMQIIEKGIWDEVFSMEGGDGSGNVHMKLRFFLSEEDRNRIRVMRESVIKKKHEMKPNIKFRLSDEQVSDAVSSKVEEASRERRRIVGSVIPNATDMISQGASSPPVTLEVKTKPTQVNEKIPAEKIKTQFPFSNVRSDIEKKVVPKVQDGLIRKPQNEEPLKKTPSNVRKMISAFEITKHQDVKSLKKSASVPSGLNRSGKESLHDFRNSKVVISPVEQSLRKYKDLITTNVSERADIVPNNSELSQSPNEVESIVTPSPSIIGKASHVEDISREVPMETIGLMETATESGRTNEEQFQVVQANDSSFKQLDSSDEGSTIVDIQVASSNHEPKSLENYKEDYFSSESSGMWIFPDNTRRLCITTAGKEETRIQAQDRLENKTSSVSETLEKGTKYKMAKDQNKFANLDESRSGSSPDDSSNGLIRQVMKIVVVLGFGLLVLLTRQKEPRKKRRDENVNLFTIPDYIEERRII